MALTRLQKFLADAGVASRRASEKLILDGEIQVNGQVIRQLGTKVDPIADKIAVRGDLVRPRKKVYLALNKPPGYLCTRKDPGQRKTVHELLPKEWAGLFTVGRLDQDSQGLLLLTNDGDFSLKITHPRYGTRKHYLVDVEGKFQPATCQVLKAGIVDEGERLFAREVRIVRSSNRQSHLEIELDEGKYREVRRLLESVGHPVLRLCRTQIGALKLGQLPEGRWRFLSPTEVKSLLPPNPESMSVSQR
jgi:pseudouridine synthase